MEDNKNTDDVKKSIREKQNANLIKITKETASDYGKKGGVNSGIAKRKKRDLRESAKALLEVCLNESKAREILGDDVELLEGEFSVGTVLNMRMLQEVKAGNVKAYEVMRDTAGYKPTESVNLEANVISETDKKLLDNIAKRTGIKPE